MRKIEEARYLWPAFLVFLFSLSWTQIADYDFWWHLNLGRQISDQLTPIVRDRFSYTFAGQPQFSAEWLADLFLYLVYVIGGFPLINIYKFLLLAGTFYFLRKTAEAVLAEKSKTSPLAVFVALVLTAFAIRFRLFVRPYLFSFLFFALTLWLLTLYRQQRDSKLLVWLLPVLLLWANVSKGFFFGPVLIGLWACSDLISRRIDRGLWAVLAGGLVMSMISPEGWAPYRLLLDLAGQETLAVVGEQQPLSVSLLWGGGLAYTWGFQCIFILGLVYLLFFRGWRNVHALGLFCVFLLPALKMVRMIDFFSLAAILVITPALARLFDLPCASRFLTTRAALCFSSVIILALGPIAVVCSESYSFGAAAKPGNLPLGALDFLDKNGISGRVFNSYPYGGYIAWRRPDLPVYIDGRINQLFPPDFHKRYFELIHTPQAWAEEQQKWGFDIAIIEYARQDGGRHFPRHLAENAEWALVYWDDHSAVWLKRSPRYATVIDRYGYRLARPAFYELEYLNKERSTRSVPQLLEDARHDVALNPDNQEARLALVYVMYAVDPRRYSSEIMAELEACLALSPDLAMEHSALGMLLLEAGRKEEAARHARLALQLDENDKGGLYLKEKLGGRL